jgi:hypothetical protein
VGRDGWRPIVSSVQHRGKRCILPCSRSSILPPGARVECRSEWPGDLTASLEAALPEGVVAGAEPLSYLGFFGHG